MNPWKHVVPTILCGDFNVDVRGSNHSRFPEFMYELVTRNLPGISPTTWTSFLLPPGMSPTT
ncbi:hypothetical protein IscW_ISCW009666 [Ixodes scapularis]|uniref:Endonuclease/exonuclease/phosphatase domain-containing protein n=1 Tax=Ixodes scapularis TaxID=6945 RepID=B7PXF5_IXOSC|nr:hypothetical protein IscW_ISCW009666 [Ixodes scapularis]|eukprot:XP_002400419.1 hypothetical protein IscW_ISCW009666 [Ixodes scapularis]